uniref:Uncharacterized protein n=1 Tax=Lepeophtheirus salmonis TaxID=72036 RepID=A0A0K2TMF0_LEPSM
MEKNGVLFRYLILIIICMTCKARYKVCCMEGIKIINGMTICNSPCCEGYEEIATILPRIKPIIYCRKVQDETGMVNHHLLKEHSAFIWKY